MKMTPIRSSIRCNPSARQSRAVKPRVEVPVFTGQSRILLVDDDHGVRDSLAGVLMAEGFLVVPAANGAEALIIAHASPVDMVILDLNMPVKNGWDTFEQLSAEHPLLPVIIVTARPNQLFTALGAGVGALLEKPLDIPNLLTTIRRLLKESDASHLRRLAGQKTPFHYQAATR